MTDNNHSVKRLLEINHQWAFYRLFTKIDSVSEAICSLFARKSSVSSPEVIAALDLFVKLGETAKEVGLFAHCGATETALVLDGRLEFKLTDTEEVVDKFDRLTIACQQFATRINAQVILVRDVSVLGSAESRTVFDVDIDYDRVSDLNLPLTETKRRVSFQYLFTPKERP